MRPLFFGALILVLFLPKNSACSYKAACSSFRRSSCPSSSQTVRNANTICSPRTKHRHNRHQISLSLSSSFPFCPLTRPCPFRPPFVPSLGVLDFKTSRSISQQPFGLHAAHSRNSSLALGSCARVVIAFLRPCLVRVLPRALSMQAQQQRSRQRAIKVWIV